jgi:hypothetical protein
MFIPRHPVIEDQFCSYATQSGTGAEGVGGVIAYAGSVVYLKDDATNQEAEVIKLDHAAGNAGAKVPFGFLMQKVKTGYHQVHPTGYYMPGDLGSSDVIAQASYNTAGTIIGTKSAPAGVAHLGIWDTVHYVADGGSTGTDNVYSNYVPVAPIVPGAALYPAADQGKVTNSLVASDGDDFNGEYTKNCDTYIVARVVRGASVAKITANCKNTALYPIRIKLLV